jgi:hypothetical protein
MIMGTDCSNPRNVKLVWRSTESIVILSLVTLVTSVVTVITAIQLIRLRDHVLIKV